MAKRREHREKYWREHDKDEYTCPECGRGREEVEELQVHHKDRNTHDGSLENLVGLCRSCHWEHHGIEPGKRTGQWQARFFNEYNSDETPLKYL
jgi:5-methylcytosine-specific restriction endonuclease McrA